MQPFRNHYYLLRHGHSLANETHVISSVLQDDHYPLTEDGIQTVTRSIQQSPLTHDTIIFCSPFRRTMQTAAIAQTLLGCRPSQSIPLLGERGFGKLNGCSTRLYPAIWVLDKANIDLSYYGVESAAAVSSRMMQVIRQSEQCHEDQTILVVSHGDPLQILVATITGLSPNLHRQIPSFHPGELTLLAPKCD